MTYYLEIYSYHKSLLYIHSIREWRPLPLVMFLHFCSYTGDVDIWWAIAFLYWSFSKQPSRTYFANLFMFNASVYSLTAFGAKLLFHSGRPYLERIELGDMTLKELTSAEFGNPSGHSLSSMANPLFLYIQIT
jgi:hypothetical protein